MSKEEKYNSNDIVTSQKLLPQKFNCDNQKIMKILVDSTKKAQNGGVQVVEVKGSFSSEEIRAMKFIMKQKGYKTWKSEGGYVFTPVKSTTLNVFGKGGGFNFNNQNTMPWGGRPDQVAGFGGRGWNGVNFGWV